jgi:hypothetical protein
MGRHTEKGRGGPEGFLDFRFPGLILRQARLDGLEALEHDCFSPCGGFVSIGLPGLDLNDQS